MTQKSPFAPATGANRKMKVLLAGAQKTGKTEALLSWPRVALVDSEDGAAYHVDRVAPFVSTFTQDIDTLLNLISTVRADAGASFDTLGIDSITVFRDVEVSRLMREAGKKFGYRERGFINARMVGIWNALMNLPIHLVVTAREDDLYERDGDSLRRIGRVPDVDKAALYAFDFVIQMSHDFKGTVLYSRSGDLPKGHVLPKVTYEALAAAIIPNDLRNVHGARAFFTHWNAQGVSNDDALKALGIDKASQWTQGRAAADAAVQAWLEKQTKAEPIGK